MAITKAELVQLLDEYNGIDNECIMNIKLIKATVNHIPEGDDLSGLESINSFISNGKAYDTNLNQKRNIAQELHEIFTELTTYVKAAVNKKKTDEKTAKSKDELNKSVGEAKARFAKQNGRREKSHIVRIIVIVVLALIAVTAVIAGLMETFGCLGDIGDKIATTCGIIDFGCGVGFFVYELIDDKKAKGDAEETLDSIDKLEVNIQNFTKNTEVHMHLETVEDSTVIGALEHNTFNRN